MNSVRVGLRTPLCRYGIVMLWLLLSAVCGRAAEQGDWEAYLTELYENEDGAAVSMEEAYESLAELAQQPLDINTATQEDLMRIVGLDINQINDILEYRYRYGKMRSITELAHVRSIDSRLRLYLQNFLAVYSADAQPWYSKQRLKEGVRHLHHELALTMQTPTYYRAGDIHAPPKTYLGENRYAGKYLGDPTKHSVRYSLSMGDEVRLNLTGAKLAAEPFGTYGNNLGYDRYAINLTLRRIGAVRYIIAGHYKGQFGMGLILNNGFSLGKQGMLTSMGRRMASFSPYSSSGDGKRFQGIATAIDLTERISLAAFVSYRAIDATLNADSTISTILTSPYHRTENDMKKRNNSHLMTTGVHVGYERPDWGIGVNAIYSSLDRALNPTYSKGDSVSKSKMYRLYYPRGTRMWNVSMDYRYRWRDIAFAGEIATGGNNGGDMMGTTPSLAGSIAMINNVTWRSPWDVTLMVLQRYYSYQYSALYGNSFSENSSVQNESGLYIGAKWQAAGSLVIDAYTDIAYFPWFRYLVSHSSYSWDNSIMATLTRGDASYSLRYRIRKKQRDLSSNNSKVLTTKTDQRLRLLCNVSHDHWNSRTQIEGCMLSFDGDSKGMVISQAVGYKWLSAISGKTTHPTKQKEWQAYAHVAYFNTQDYDSRMYIYERGMRYGFGSASYYGHGMRMALLAKYQPSQSIMLQAKVGHTRYFDRKTIGTAERMIFSSYCTDIDVQLILNL